MSRAHPCGQPRKDTGRSRVGTRRANRHIARKTQCPACGRKKALRPADLTGYGHFGYVCRWCDFIQVAPGRQAHLPKTKPRPPRTKKARDDQAL